MPVLLKNFCGLIERNKNVLMLLSAGVYILALYAVLSSHLLVLSLIFTIVLILLISFNLLPTKYALVGLTIFYLGVINTSARLKNVDELLNLAPLNSEITGKVLTIPQGKLEGKQKFFFDVEKIKFGSHEEHFENETVLVTLNSDDADLKLFDTISLSGRLSAPFKAGNPSQFDYGNYLRNHRAYSVFYAKDYVKLNSTLSLKEMTMQKINNYRENVINIHSKYLTSPNLEILGGIVFGDDAVSPPQNIKQSFINSGLLHILAASGMNVAFIYSFFFAIMSLFRINFKAKVSLGIVTVVIYSLMTGLGASVIRAACMLIFVLLGKLIDRDAHSISLLSFVALLMLIYNPMYINDVGFQLSFIVTFGILVMAPAVVRFKNKFLDFLAGTVAIPIIAQLWVIPIQIFYFNNISLYSVFANIMSVPILMVLSFGGFVSSLLCAIKPLASFICQVFDFILNPLLTILVNISDFWGRLPHSTMQTTHPSVFQIFVYYGILLCIAGLLYKELREKYLKKLLISFAVLFVTWMITLIPVKNSNLEITAFDVGNADCFLIKSPQNEYLMIDTAKNGYQGGKSQAELIVLKYFKDNGIKNIDTIIVTHFDNDHCGGAVDLMKGVKVKNLYVNDLNHNSYAAKDIYKTAKETGVNLILAENSQTVYDKSGVSLVNYLPKTGRNDNDNSIITTLEYKDFSMLFTGDAGEEALNSVIGSLGQNYTVLKVPHHGAHGVLNKKIMRVLNPKYSLISVGENKFGHPDVYTLSLLDNSTVLRTDVHNAVRFVIDKHGLKVLTYDMKKRKFVY